MPDCAVEGCDYSASQLWELNDEVLQNKEGHWVSDQDWNFKPGKDGLIYIESITDNQVLEFRKFDNKVVLEEFEEDKAEQLWKKGEPDDEGYFTLENSKVPKIMTAFSATILKVKDDFSMAEKRPYQTFNLPKDELLQSKWLYNLNRPKTYTNPETGNLVKIKQKNLAVCIRHFRLDDFELTSSDKEKGRIRKRKILIEGAVPTLLLPENSEKYDLDPEDMSPFEPEENTPQESEFWSNALGLLFQVCLLLVIASWVKDYGLFKSYFEFFGNPMIPGENGVPEY